MSEVTQTQKKYFYFITLLRAFAAIIITNAHYTGIYPSDIIANGGLLGDVIFFSVSGFCLANPRMQFGKWYAKRLWRIYTVVWVITIVYVLLGSYEVSNITDGLKWFIHPTKYHFVASITLLYIPLYFVARYVKLSRKNYAAICIGLFAVQMLIYLTVYDTGYYHIDKVREPMIEFLFFQSMLLGLFFRQECETGTLDRKKSSLVGQEFVLWILLIVILGLYFASKMVFVKKPSLSELQILNQVILFMALFCLFRRAYTLEGKLKSISNTNFWKCVEFLSDHTLEIYCVQYVLIDLVRDWNLLFPLNWLMLTTIILLAAAALRWVSQKVIKLVKI